MKIVRKFWRKLIKIEQKILNDSRKIMETLWEKTEVMWNWCWYYEEILGSFSETISTILGKSMKKSWKNFEKMQEVLRTNLKKKTFWWKLCKILEGIFRKTYKILYENFKQFQRKIAEEPLRNFWDIWTVLKNLCWEA